MRLWSVHPKHLDAKGLVALWREGLLARHVLAGKTKGYRHHPQLERFRARKDPLAAIDCYLSRVWDEANARGYSFDRAKIHYRKCKKRAHVGKGQIDYEWRHLRNKLKTRDPKRFRASTKLKPDPHPCFEIVPGPLATWERS